MTQRLGSVLVFILALLLATAGTGLAQQEKPPSNQTLIARYSRVKEPQLSQTQLLRLLRKKIKYVFVIYQENRSFDSYFGTFPAAEGLFVRPRWQTPGFYQPLRDTDGRIVTIHPFRIGPKEYAADTDDVDHSHPSIVAKMHIINGRPRMDRFALIEEEKYSHAGVPSLKAKQMGELAMAYEDCDTIPLLWRLAGRFTLFDHVFQEMTGPSTPGNIAIIAAQTGATQWVLHPEEAYPDNGGRAPGVPVMNDNLPFWGSPADPTPEAEKMPINPRHRKYAIHPALNLTFASLPLTLKGKDLKQLTASDRDPQRDLADVRRDVDYISARPQTPFAFGWYQEGYGKGPVDDDDGPLDAGGLHASYITHHNGPQYFGYISNNPHLRSELHDLGDFFAALKQQSLPAQGGVFFVKGGYRNTLGLKPADPDPKVQKNFRGDDDHPAYSDAQISEALVAEAVNHIAASPYWAQSAIIITWDDSEGDYDHLPPPVRVHGPNGSVISDGPRVPLILVSPYARAGHVAHAMGNQASVVKFVDRVFGLPPLALLPDELRARKLGEKKFHQKDLGPQDALTQGVTDLTGAFSPARLLGRAAPLPAAYAEIPDELVRHLPQETGYGCQDLGIITTDRALGIENRIPSDFNPRPKTNPSQ